MGKVPNIRTCEKQSMSLGLNTFNDAESISYQGCYRVKQSSLRTKLGLGACYVQQLTSLGV